jgi:hypothetical protein
MAPEMRQKNAFGIEEWRRKQRQTKGRERRANSFEDGEQHDCE